MATDPWVSSPQSSGSILTMEDLSLSLEPKEKPEEQLQNENLSLAQIIPRITQERGSFAYLSEEDLLAEIEGVTNNMEVDTVEQEEDLETKKDEDADGDEKMEDEDKADEQEEKAHEQQKQSFNESRQQLVELVGSALNESALSLDFVSLLLSCLRPAAGGTSMSQHLKDHVPTGSLSADALTIAVPEENPRIGAGWKIQTLSKASDLLGNAANRLREEVSKENTYWKSVLDTVNTGEVLFKIRKGDARGLAIKYGFGDSGSEYRDKGTAMIKRNEDGTMAFKFDKVKRRHVMRVTLYDNNQGEMTRIGCSSYKNTLVEEHSVSEEIRNARKLIFEEELFFEIVKEARRLAAFKVQVVDGKVVINLQDQVLEIDHIDPLMEDEDEDIAHSIKADLICNALKLLLCDGHRRNLERRRSDPPPMNSKIPQRGAPLRILRPLIMNIQHAKLLKRTSRLLEMILQNRGSCDLQLDKYTNNGNEEANRLGRLMSQPISTYTLTTEKVQVRVDVSSPAHPNVALFEVDAKHKQDQTLLSKASLFEMGELEEWINWILNRDCDQSMN